MKKTSLSLHHIALLKPSIMKRFLILILFLGFLLPIAQSQTTTGCGGTKVNEPQKPIKLGIVIYSNDPETVGTLFALPTILFPKKILFRFF